MKPGLSRDHCKPHFGRVDRMGLHHSSWINDFVVLGGLVTVTFYARTPYTYRTWSPSVKKWWPLRDWL